MSFDLVTPLRRVLADHKINRSPVRRLVRAYTRHLQADNRAGENRSCVLVLSALRKPLEKSNENFEYTGNRYRKRCVEHHANALALPHSRPAASAAADPNANPGAKPAAIPNSGPNPSADAISNPAALLRANVPVRGWWWPPGQVAARDTNLLVKEGQKAPEASFSETIWRREMKNLNTQEVDAVSGGMNPAILVVVGPIGPLLAAAGAAKEMAETSED
ncbi:hypothetical protein INR77_06725 [Erythrobacter sp. SCSIO 43205]|uniref:hypothetical protein n=1 Tax=Erythrobacter sp. SCSIO 43205 TaxID=2779361 RepID=UPI001CA7DD0D|nr:hypothetical protein [Erythrobacter sp. SCSIO 43205]UAB79366.1 hypothetical protein INR77_06725 [Erythrobacter sp. SCSIO 43205]